MSYLDHLNAQAQEAAKPRDSRGRVLSPRDLLTQRLAERRRGGH